MRVDISGVAVGTQLTVLFLGKPVFIRHRTEEEIAEARAVPVTDLSTRMRATRTSGAAEATDENRADFDENTASGW
jgi:ubiquinol-cytochrome c reductase iron-sulfur subunit